MLISKDGIYVEVLAGAWIRNAAKESLTLAREERCNVHFTFNGVHVVVNPRNTLAEIEEQYEHKLNKRN